MLRRKLDKKNYELKCVGYDFQSSPTPNSNLVPSEQDSFWLAHINVLRKEKYKITEDYLLWALQNIENDSYFNVSRSAEDDAKCSICGESQNVQTFSDIILCDLCDEGVHLHCYGVTEIPENEWLCRKCQLSPSTTVKCSLCPNLGGVFTTTVSKIHPWVHVACAWLHPKADFLNESGREPVTFNWSGLSKVVCKLCDKKGGAAIKCSQKYCRKGAFHVSCAFKEGGFTIVDDKIYCNEHAQSHQTKKSHVIPILKNRKAYLQKPMVLPSVKQEVLNIIQADGVRRDILSNNDNFVEKVKEYWLLKRVMNAGVPLFNRTQIKIVVKEIQSINGEDDSICIEDVRAHVSGCKMQLTEARHEFKEIFMNNMMQDYTVNFKELIQPPSVTIFMEYLLNKLCQQDSKGYFAELVDPIDVENYYEVIKSPMAFSIMRQNLWMYLTVEDLQNDFNLIIENCLDFNASNTVYAIEARRLRKWSVGFFQKAKKLFCRL